MRVDESRMRAVTDRALSAEDRRPPLQAVLRELSIAAPGGPFDGTCARSSPASGSGNALGERQPSSSEGENQRFQAGRPRRFLRRYPAAGARCARSQERSLVHRARSYRHPDGAIGEPMLVLEFDVCRIQFTTDKAPTQVGCNLCCCTRTHEWV